MAQKRKSAYSNTDDFVVSDDDQQRSSARQTKKSKKTVEKTSSHFSAPAPTAAQRDDENNPFWEISKARRVALQDFKGKKMIAIREYYEKDGKWLPGKKGISLTLEQYAGLVSVLPAVENELRRNGIQDVPRPAYEPVVEDGGSIKDEDNSDASEEHQAQARANHEATSDEDE